MKRNTGLFVTGSLVLSSLLLGSTAFAAGPGMMGRGHAPGVFGTVSAINGTTLTVESKGFGQSATATTYTVDASKATVTKSGNASTLSAVTLGDTVMVAGTVTGTSVVATTIRDGVMGHGGMRPGGMHASSTVAVIQGNGQPVIGGAVTAVSGSSLTVTNKSNVTYTVDVASAKIVKAGATSTIASVSVGDNVVVQGTVNGTAVVASSVLDQGAPIVQTNTATAATGVPQGHMGGFMGMMGGFFHNLFGFF